MAPLTSEGYWHWPGGDKYNNMDIRLAILAPGQKL